MTDQQEKAASQMAKLLAEQREALTDELMRLRDEKDAEIAALKKQLKMLVEKGLIKEVAKPDPPSKKAPPRAPDQKGFVLVNDGRSIAEQLREQVEKKGLKVMDLFRLMDEDNDGTINKKDWTKAMSKIGPDFPKDALDKAFDEADPDNSNSVEYKELEGFIKGRKPSAKPIEVKQKKGLQKRVKPSLLAALATSMGVKPELIADAMDTVGKGEDDFEAMMKARARRLARPIWTLTVSSITTSSRRWSRRARRPSTPRSSSKPSSRRSISTAAARSISLSSSPSLCATRSSAQGQGDRHLPYLG